MWRTHVSDELQIRRVDVSIVLNASTSRASRTAGCGSKLFPLTTFVKPVFHISPIPGVLGTRLHGVHWKPDFSIGGPGGQPLHIPGSCGWWISGTFWTRPLLRGLMVNVCEENDSRWKEQPKPWNIWLVLTNKVALFGSFAYLTLRCKLSGRSESY